MELLAGHRVVASPGMAQRPLARYFRTLGAEVIRGELDSVEVPSAELASASFFIEDLGLPRLEELELSRAAIANVNPRLIHVSVTTFGSYGPHARWRGGELVTSAMGGVLRLTGEPDRPPVKEALDACLFHADMVAAAGAMAAHYSRGTSGRGQHVDIAAQEVAFSRLVNSILVWQFDRRKLHRVGGAVNYGKATVRCIWKLADGWCFHTLMTGRFGAPANKALSDWMDETGARNPMRHVDWLQYNRSTLDPALRSDWEAAMADFFSTRSRADISGEGRRRGINACVLATPADVLLDPHLRDRSFWAERDGLRYPSRFAALRPGPPPSAAPDAPASPPHSAALHAPASPAPSVALRPPASRLASGAARPGPLAGVRVLDFSWALVGSITTKVLGDLGAEVIKIESRGRPCLSRLDVQVAASRAGDFDDKPWFAHLNTSKRSVALDMKRPGALELLQPLIDWADVIAENFSPGTMTKLGLDYDTLVRRNPSLVMVSGSVYGQTGPLAREWGVDGTGAALSGRTYLTGWADRGPVMPGAVPYGDVIVPYVMAATVAAALESRRRTGRGTHIDASMYEICVQQMFDAIQGAQTGTPPSRVGNYSAGTFWQAVLPAAGQDRWVAVTVANEREWQLLLALAGNTDLAGWSAGIPDQVLADLLQAQGIAAGVVQDIEDLVDRDAGLRARGALVELDHARLGRFGHVRTPIDFSVDGPQPFRAPSIGEHTREVLLGIGGVEPERFAALQESGVFT
jgi:crotonobetainyl-CoA:carnitine CoA-transferase CaiB-like acyl-CoA transferase